MIEETILERNKHILYAVINNYILTSLPVSSRIITKRYNIHLSPASVRSIMADLEDKGYLTQPHTSAGRIPTDKGLRFYVDGMLKVRILNRNEKEHIRQKYRYLLGVKEVMKKTSNVLSLFSNYMGLVLAPKFSKVVIKHIKFIRLRPGHIMVILISVSGIVHNRIVNADEDISQNKLDKMSTYLNKIASNFSLAQIKIKVLKEMKKEKILYDKLLSKALEIGHKAIKEAEDYGEIYIEGRVNMLEQPEFNNVERMKSLFKALEEKNVLIDVLDKSLKAEGVQTFIGSENKLNEVKGCSIVVAPYGIGDYSMGTLGVLGPKSMNYAKIIPLVSYTAKFLGELLGKGDVVS